MIYRSKLFFLRKEIQQLKIQIDGLCYMKRTTVALVSSKGGNHSPVESSVEKIEELCNRLNDLITEYAEEYKRVMKVIDSIEDPETRVIARMRFIDGLGYREIGDRLFLDRTTVQKKLKRYIESTDSFTI